MLECHDFRMEVIVPVLLGQETPTNEQVYIGEAGEKGNEVLNSVTKLSHTHKWWNPQQIYVLME